MNRRPAQPLVAPPALAACLLLAALAGGRGAVAADTAVQIEWGGRIRTAILHSPPAGDGTSPRPLVLLLHGGGGHGAQAQASCGMDAVADREGFLVAYPDGTSAFGNLLTWNAANCCGYAWENDVDDAGFLRALVGEIARRHPVDPRRVYATGMSNGGMMSYRLGCRAADLFAAIAPVAGALNETVCSPAAPLPVIVFHGTDDQQVLYDGGFGPNQITPRFDQPVSHAVAFWVAHDRCATTPETKTSPSGAIVRDTWSGGTDGAEVVLTTVVGGGHAWPGSVAPRPGADPPTQEISASELMWAFFARHPKPAGDPPPTPTPATRRPRRR